MMQVTLKTNNPPKQPNSLLSGYVSKHWWPELRLDLDLQGIAADFYLFYAVKDGDIELEAKFEEYAQVVAKQLAVYLDAACGGELRHVNFAGMGKSVINSRSIARRDWRGKRQDQGLNLLQSGRQRFFSGGWAGGYGGPRWGNVANLLVQHLRGEVSTTYFVDQAFGLEHNGGCVFNKLADYWTQGELKKVLDANLNQNWKALMTYASPWAVTMFTDWLGAEAEIEVEGYAASHPRSVTTDGFAVGGKLRVGPKARNVAWRGQELTIQGIKTEMKKKGKQRAFKVNCMGKTAWLTEANVMPIEKINGTAIEYIAEATP